MPESTLSFKASIAAWKGKTRAQLEALGRRSAFRLVEDIVLDTPVHTGFLRGSWQPGLNEPPAPKAAGADPSGGVAMADAAASLQDLDIGMIFYFVNGAVYARRVEYGFVGEDSLGRHYNQTGRFYMTNNLDRWQEIVEAEALKLWGAS